MKKNNLSCDIGHLSLNHYGEQLCGDHVDTVEEGDTTIIVLADGMGSGVKASILSTLTSKIISTMLAAGLGIRDAVETIAATLPICADRILDLYYYKNSRKRACGYHSVRKPECCAA